MKKKIKKAFTLVELLVVIAILAILATVSIVGYNSFTKKAKVSNDTVLVKQMNDIVIASKQTDEANPTMEDAIADVLDGGYDLDKLTPTTNNYNIVWDSKNDQMVLLDENMNAVYPSDADMTKKNNYFAMVSSEDEITSGKKADFSHYLKDGFITNGDIETSTGIDVGRNTNINKITYTGSTASKDVILRTNSVTTDLVVNGYVASDETGDSVYHYGEAGMITASVAMHCYYENGNTAFVELTKGKVVVNKDAAVKVVYVNGTTIEVSTNGGAVENAYATTEVSNKGNVKIDVKTSNDIEQIKKDTINIATKRVVQLGATDNYLSLNELKDAWNNTENTNHELVKGTTVFNLIADVDMKGIVWSDGIGCKNSDFTGTINGNDHTIKNFTFASTTEAGGLIQFCKDTTIVKDLSFDNVSVTAKEKVGAVIGYANEGTITLENVKVNSGNINSEQYAGGLVGKTKANAFFKNCTNNAIVQAKYGPTGGSHAMVAAGILANAQGSVDIVFDNCVNNGKVSSIHNTQSKSTVAGGIYGYSYQSKSKAIAFITCENNGTINIQGAEDHKFSGEMLGGWGESINPYTSIYMENCKANGSACDSNAIGKCDVAESEALLTIKNGDTPKVYFMGTNGIDNPKLDKSDEWKEVTSCTATVNYNWENKTITVEYK